MGEGMKRLRFCAIAPVLLLLGSCPLTPDLQVLQTLPADQAVGVPIDSVVRIFFNR